MKKLFAVALSLALVLSLVACGGTSKIKDGTYKAEMSDAVAEASYGWRDTLTVTYKDGKVSDLDFDSFDADGNRKSEATAEAYPMDPAPSAWMPQLEENLKATTDPDKVAAVAGATNSSNNAKLLYKAVIEKANAGDTTTAVVDADVAE